MGVQAPFFFPMCGSQDFMPPPTPNFSDDHHHHLLPCFSFHNSNNNNTNHHLLSQTAAAADSTSTSLHEHLQIQRQELDAILQLQSDRLRMALQEQGKHQIGLLLKGMEVRATSMLTRKQDDLALAARKNAELEACLRRAEAEKDTWRRLAMEKEAAAVDLNRQLELLKERMGGGGGNAADDAESSAGDVWPPAEQGSGNVGGGGCRMCGVGEACMVFLPCRHVCSCKDCEGFLGICPVCTSLKEATLEVFFSASVN